ncbi:unnamed protein product [Ranitomeya imitator]|uniref:GIY-YIG domain-containing protein n=1 Tax=Ranitomeya imitator TaxID=111125 RepID=A0ABN9KWH9_9NEOB|nr:unnamed protein product [Ranitomeya imitator]
MKWKRNSYGGAIPFVYYDNVGIRWVQVEIQGLLQGSLLCIPFIRTCTSSIIRFVNTGTYYRSFPEIPEFQTPFLPCFRRPCNLKNKIVRADIGSLSSVPRQHGRQTQRKGTFPCFQCAQCANVLKGPKISHPLTGTDIPIQGFYTCDSKQVVYAIKCPCGKIYVGETTQAIKDRISHHKSDIRCGKDHLPIPHHFREAGHGVTQLRFLVLEQISQNRSGERIKRLKSVYISDPAAGLTTAWDRLEKGVCSPEAIEDALLKQLQDFPKISGKDASKFQELSDLPFELQLAKTDTHSPGLSYLDTTRGVKPIVVKLPYNVQKR